jgi:ubiquinone/menaquinone biosynthesis C-methylase UbiE
MFERKNFIQEQLGDTDIYLIDQILKNRYNYQDKILDAGCGNGRNLHWFLRNEFEVYGIDSNEKFISSLMVAYPNLIADRFLVSLIEKTLFPDSYFDHIICNAVLHFADSTLHFKKMLHEIVRILKTGGSLFIRMTSDIGIENKIKLVGDGVYFIPDGSKRFLLTRQLLKECMLEFNLSFAEQLKTVNVDDIRCMTTLVLQKK